MWNWNRNESLCCFIWLEGIMLILYYHRERYSGMKASFHPVYSINYGTYGARLSQRKTPWLGLLCLECCCMSLCGQYNLTSYSLHPIICVPKSKIAYRSIVSVLRVLFVCALASPLMNCSYILRVLLFPRHDTLMNYSYIWRVLFVPRHDTLMKYSYIPQALFVPRHDTLMNYSYILRVLFVCSPAWYPNEL